jgi:hypothetical protein
MNRYEDEESIIRWLKIEGAVFKDAATIKEFGVSALEKLAKDKDANTRLAVAANPRTPISSLTVLAGDEDDDVRAGVASNPNTPTELLELLAKDSDEVVRWAVVGNISTPSDTLKLLSQDEEDVVRRAVLHNRNSSEAILHIQDEEDQDEEEIDLHDVLNEGICTWISRKFMAFSEYEVLRLTVVERSEGAISPRTLKFLSEDEFDIEISPDGHGCVYDHVRTAVARHPETPIEVLEKLSEDDEPRVVDAVAGNVNTPVHILALLGQEEVDLENSYGIWEGSSWITLAANKNLPAQLVEQFCVQTNPYVRRVAFDHAKATLESKALASLLGFPKSWNAQYESIWQEFNWSDYCYEWRTWDESALEMEMIKALSTLTPERLSELASDPNVNVRRAVSHHPLAPVNLLASDSDELVRYAISKNPLITPEAKESIALMGGVLDEDKIIELVQEIEGGRERSVDFWQQGLLESEEKRARVVMSSIGNWEIPADDKKKLEKWAEVFASRAINRKVSKPRPLDRYGTEYFGNE